MGVLEMAPNQKQRGSAYLEIVKEEGEFVPRAVQARGMSADGIGLHLASYSYHQPITTRSGTTKVAIC